MRKKHLTKCSEMIIQKKTIKLVLHCLFCNSRRSAKLNTVTKLKTKENTVSEIMFCCKYKCVHSSLLPYVHYEEKICGKDIYSIKK